MIESENKYLTFFSKHWATCFVILVICGSLALFFERSRSSSHLSAKKDYIVAKQIFDRFHSGEALSIETLDTFEEILADYPELHSSYDYALTHCFLWQDKPAKALPLAEKALTRSKNALHPLYRRFAETTLLVATQNFGNAYMNTEALEQELKEAPSCEMLRAYNLLRLAFLARALGNPDKQRQAWETLCALPTFAKLSPLFVQGKTTLPELMSL